MPIFGWLAAAIVGGFASGLVQGIAKFAISLGVGFVLFKGIDVLMDSISAHIILNLNSIDPQVKNMLGLLKVDRCVNVLVSAYGVRLILKGVTNGVFNKLELKETAS